MAGVTYTNWAKNRQAPWKGDYGNREHLIPGGARLDAAQFRTLDAVVVTAGAAAAGATALPVTALSGPLPVGTVLDFGTNKFARLTVAAIAGATSLTVAALPTAFAGGELATYPGTGLKTVVSGTLLGRMRAERDAGTGYGPWATGDEEIYLLAFDVPDATGNPDCELYSHGALVKENFLPGFATLAAGALTAIRANYETTRGSN